MLTPSSLWSQGYKRLLTNTGRAISEWPLAQKQSCCLPLHRKCLFCSEGMGSLKLSPSCSCLPFLMETLLLKYTQYSYQEGFLTGLPVLGRLMVITETSVSVQNIMQDLSHMSSLAFREQNAVKINFRVYVPSIRRGPCFSVINCMFTVLLNKTGLNFVIGKMSAEQKHPINMAQLKL